MPILTYQDQVSLMGGIASEYCEETGVPARYEGVRSAKSDEEAISLVVSPLMSIVVI